MRLSSVGTTKTFVMTPVASAATVACASNLRCTVVVPPKKIGARAKLRPAPCDIGTIARLWSPGP